MSTDPDKYTYQAEYIKMKELYGKLKRENNRLYSVTVVLFVWAFITTAMYGVTNAQLNDYQIKDAFAHSVGETEDIAPSRVPTLEEEISMVEDPHFRVESTPQEYLTTYRITCYGPPPTGGFPLTNMMASLMTVQDGLDLADSMGLDGICAVSPGSLPKWYSRIRDETPPVLHIDGFGDFLALDRTANWVRGVVDIYNPDLSPSNMWNVRRSVHEVRY